MNQKEMDAMIKRLKAQSKKKYDADHKAEIERENREREERKRRWEESERKRKEWFGKANKKEKDADFFTAFDRERDDVLHGLLHAYIRMFLGRMAGSMAGIESIFGSLTCPVESFKLLQIEDITKATEDTINFAFRKMAMVHHPDKGGSQEMFVKITNAKDRCLAYIKARI